jgi:hypothetical protein
VRAVLIRRHFHKNDFPHVAVTLRRFRPDRGRDRSAAPARVRARGTRAR